MSATRVGLLAAAALLLPSLASAHRVDEYLQATRIGLDADAIAVELDLTPGEAVAGRVLARVDSNGDGEVDAREAGAYAREVSDDVHLEFDGCAVPLAFQVGSFPAAAEMRAGLGTIRLAASARVRMRAGNHRVTYTNRHMTGSSAYLVNALAVTDRRLLIDATRRDYRQRTFAIDFAVGIAGGDRLLWSVAGLAMVGGLFFTRRRAWTLGRAPDTRSDYANTRG